MTIYYVLATGFGALLVAYAAYGSWERKRRSERRRARLNRNLAYQKLWDIIMIRPKTRRLTDQRKSD